MERRQKSQILKDLNKKIVFLVGPRQVGKTWLAKDIAKNFTASLYLSYDQVEDKMAIKNKTWFEDVDLLVLDELHKMPNWKNYLKGLYDTKPEHLKIIVTGSARLDVFRQVGDSLAGRFFTHHLLPFSPAELIDTKYAQDIDRFINRGGFPEPFLAKDAVDADRWRAQYIDSLLRDDIFDFDKIGNFQAIRIVFELLRTKIGSPISYKSIAEDVGIAPNTVKKYIQILEALYIVFRITPFAKNIARSLSKEPKIYFYDTGLVKGDIGIKMENFVAMCLLKHVNARLDYEGKDCRLHYLRTKDGREVDFALVEDDKISQMIEVKNSAKEISKSLCWFQQKYNFPAVQIVRELRQEKLINGIEVRKLANFLSKLKL
jgi:predicted AAA+ superfamily ATPase